MLRVLLVDDDAEFQSRFRAYAENVFQVESALSFADAYQRVQQEEFDAILLDISLGVERDGLGGERDGLTLLEKMRARDAEIPIIIVSGDRSSTTAQRSKELGADAYAFKHKDVRRLRSVIQQYVRQSCWRRQARRLQRHNPDLVGSSPHMDRLRQDIVRCASSSANVLIRGETGVGKELVAKAIHDLSNRKSYPMIMLNAAQASDGMFEALMFGHEKGAFTGADRDREGILEMADRGTLFLDEVGAMGLNNQAKLLRVIEDGQVLRLGGGRTKQVNVRFISATHEDLEERIGHGQFARDFYYRIRKLEIDVAPLRDRLQDIPEIARSFLDRLSAEEGKPRVEVLEGALDACFDFDWPGNIRQLQTVLTNAMLEFPGVLYAGAVAKAVNRQRLASGRDHAPAGSQPLRESVLEAERRAIAAALERNDRDHDKASKELGISRSTLFKKMRALGLLKKHTQK